MGIRSFFSFVILVRLFILAFWFFCFSGLFVFFTYSSGFCERRVIGLFWGFC